MIFIVKLCLFFIPLFYLAKKLSQFFFIIFDTPLPTWTKPFQYAQQLLFPPRFFSFESQTWTQYAASLIGVSFVSTFLGYALLRLQFFLPFNPQALPNIAPDLSFNIIFSFMTNTDWQSYIPEKTLSYFSQMAVLTVQNFISSACGFCTALPLIRSLSQTAPQEKIGNFWSDFSKTLFYILLPLSFLLSLLLLSQGVIQNFDPYTQIDTLEHQSQTIPQGPVASQVAIKMLGNNGGGFFNANAAHPYENPTFFSNWIQMLSMIVMPVALVFYFGKKIRRPNHAHAILAIMSSMVFIGLGCIGWLENKGHPDLIGSHMLLEGKEARFDTFDSLLFSILTTTTGCGATNLSFDSLHPGSSFILLFNIAMGCIGFGSLGSGLCLMILYILLTLFIVGLLIGKSPEYLGRKIQKCEIQYSAFVIIITTFCGMILPSIALSHAPDLNSINPSSHTFSAILYMFLSSSANNGSGFGSLTSNLPFFNTLTGITFFLGRFFTLIPFLALAGSFAKKPILAENAEGFPLSGFFFSIMVTIIFLLITTLSFLPAFCIGPIAELLTLYQK